MTSPISFSGLATGIDTDSIIQQLMDIQRTPVTRLENENNLLALKRDGLQEVNTQLLSLQTETLNLRLESTFSSRTVKSSNDSLITASADFSAAKTTHRMKVTQLAQEAVVNSNRYLSSVSLLGTNTLGINQVGGTSRLNAPGSGRIVGGVNLTGSTTLDDLGVTDFTFKIDPDSTGGRSAITLTGIDGTTTVDDLVSKINSEIGTVKAQLIYDEASGGRVLQIGSNYVGLDVGMSGAVAEALFGLDNNASVNSNSDTDLGSARAVAAIAPEDISTGTINIVATEGLAGSITGSVDLKALAGGGDPLAMTLDDAGINDFTNFTIDPDAGGVSGNIEILHEDGSQLTGEDTVQDLIAAINNSVPGVTAQLVNGTSGEVNLRITANEGGRDLTISQIGATNGITRKLLGYGPVEETRTSTNATTDSGDFTMMAISYNRGDFSQVSRRVVSGAEANYQGIGVTDLIDGVTLTGSSTGDLFSAGSARLQLNNGDTLSITKSERYQFYGSTGVTDDSFATNLGIDPDSLGELALNRSIQDLNSSGAFSLDGGSGITVGTFKVGDSTLTLTQDEIDNGITLSEIIARINSSDEGVILNYEADSDRFIASSRAYGSTEEVTFGTYTAAAGQSNLLKVLGLTNATGNTLTSAGVSVTGVDTADSLVDAGFAIRPTSGTFSINGVSIEVDATSDTMQDVIDKINSSAAGVTASLDAAANRISLIQNVDENTVADHITVGSSSDSSNLLYSLRIIGGSNEDGSVKAAESTRKKNEVGSARKEAIFEVDGIQYNRNTNSIDDITPGVTYELLGETDGTVNLTVTGDKEKALDALANWIVEYNKTVKMMDPEAVTGDDRDKLEPITDDERNNLSYQELITRLEDYETLNKSEFIRKDSSLQQLMNTMRNEIVSTLPGLASGITSVGDIGINSGEAGSPLNDNYQGVLVLDSTDYDEILAALQDNEDLNNALEENDYDVYKLFGQPAESEASVQGTVAYNEATALANDINFQVFNGENTAYVTISAGTYSKSQILSNISSQLSSADISDISIAFDSAGHLKFSSSKTSGRAYIRILESTPSGSTDRFSTRFGIQGGSYIGPDAEEQAGIAHKIYASLREATGVGGYITQQVSTGGNSGQGSIYDRMIDIAERIFNLEERLDKRETRLRKQFAAMETAVAKLQQQQNSLAQIVSTASTSSSS